MALSGYCSDSRPCNHKERSNNCAGVSASIRISFISLEQNGKLYYFENCEFVLSLFEIIDHASYF